MKKVLVSALIAVMVGATLTGCGNKNSGNGSAVEQTSSVSAKDVVEKLKEEGFVRSPAEADDTMQTAVIINKNNFFIIEFFKLNNKIN